MNTAQLCEKERGRMASCMVMLLFMMNWTGLAEGQNCTGEVYGESSVARNQKF